MAECLAARLAAQEEQIHLLATEICALRDGLTQGIDATHALVVSPQLESLRTENEKLRYRLLHLRRGLQAMEKAQDKRPQGAKCSKAPENNASREQQINNRAANKVVINSGTVGVSVLV